MWETIDLKTYVVWLLANYDKEEVAQKLYDEGYSIEEIADELWIDEDDVKEIVI